MANIRIKDLPAAISPSSTVVTAIDDGLDTLKVSAADLVAAGRPLASQAEAEAGTNPSKAMTPLTVAQAIAAQGAGQFASSAQGAKADSAVQPDDLADVATTGSADDLADGSSKVAMTVEERGKLGGTPPTVISRAAMAALPVALGLSALLLTGSGPSYFEQVTRSDWAALEAVDTGAYELIPSTDDAAKAWLRHRAAGKPIMLTDIGGDLQKALNVASVRATALGAGVRLEVQQDMAGVYVLLSGVVVPTNVDLAYAPGMERALVLDAGALDATTLVNDEGVVAGTGGRNAIFAGIKPSERYTELPEFAAVTTLGDTRITFLSDPGLDPDDTLMVENANNYSWIDDIDRPYYHVGHRTKINGADGLVRFMSLGWRDTFTYGPNVKAWKQKTVTGKLEVRIAMRGCTLSTARAAYISSYADSVFDSIDVTDAPYAAVFLDQCRDTKLVKPRATNLLATVFPGTQYQNVYGVMLVNSTCMRVHDAVVGSNWHSGSHGGLSLRGCIQNFDCIWHDCIFMNTGAGTPHTADMHGNADKCGFVDCTFYGGMSLNGRDGFARNCTASLMDSDGVPDAKLLSMTELWGGVFTFENCHFRSGKNTGTASTDGALYITLTSAAKADLVVLFDRNCSIDAPIEQTPIHINSTGSTYKYSIEWLGRANIPAASRGLVYCRNTGGAPNPGFVHVLPIAQTPLATPLDPVNTIAAHVSNITTTGVDFQIPFSDTPSVNATNGSPSIVMRNQGRVIEDTAVLTTTRSFSLDTAMCPPRRWTMHRTGSGAFPRTLGSTGHALGPGESCELEWNGATLRVLRRWRNADVITTFSTDAAQTWNPHAHGNVLLLTGTLTAGRALTLGTTNVLEGDEVLIKISNAGANLWTIAGETFADKSIVRARYTNGAWLVVSSRVGP